jgi:NADH-quinone oxidoreductase subunit J
MPLWLFLFVGALAVISSLGVVFQTSPVHCLLALAFALIDIGVLFMGLGAVTVGFLQMIIYVGAILVLFLFVIWLLNLQTAEIGGAHLGLKLFGAIAAAGLATELFLVFFNTPAAAGAAAIAPGYGSIQSLARLMFSDYLIAFEVTSLLLLAAIVGAIGLARRIPASVGAGAAEDIAQGAQQSEKPGEAMRRAG